MTIKIVSFNLTFSLSVFVLRIAACRDSVITSGVNEIRNLILEKDKTVKV